MATQTSVMNLALTKMGASSTIIRPDESSFAAETILGVWDDVRRACLRGGRKAPRWNFAERYVETAARAPSADKPIAYGWTSAFPVPDGAVRLAEIVYPEQVADGEWRLSGAEILMKRDGPLRAFWTFDTPEVGLWDALFVETFAARIGFETCERITGLRDRKQDLFNEWVDNLNSAARIDTVENPPIDLAESSWIDARFTGPRGPYGYLR